MSKLILDIDISKTQQDVVDLFKSNNLRKGDTVQLKSQRELSSFAAMGALLFIFVCAGLYFYGKRKRQEDAQKLLDDIFKNHESPEDFEKEIEKEYGIDVEIVSSGDDKEHEDWVRTGMQNFARAYSVDEPNIDELIVKEPNPKYNPWK